MCRYEADAFATRPTRSLRRGRRDGGAGEGRLFCLHAQTPQTYRRV